MTDIEYLKKYYNGDINNAIKRLEMGEPVQYIVGNVDFFGYKIILADCNNYFLAFRLSYFAFKLSFSPSKSRQW